MSSAVADERTATGVSASPSHELLVGLHDRLPQRFGQRFLPDHLPRLATGRVECGGIVDVHVAEQLIDS